MTASYEKRPIPTASDTVAERIRHYRRQWGWDLQRLASECARVGGSGLTASVLANIESGRRDQNGRRRRDVNIDEMLILAYALRVPPVLMFIPLGTNDVVAITPALVVHPNVAFKWVEGEELPALDDRPVEKADLQQWQEAGSPLLLYREFNESVGVAGITRRQLQRAEYIGERVLEARASHYESLRILSEMLEFLIESGVRPPELDREWVDELERAGLPVPSVVAEGQS